METRSARDKFINEVKASCDYLATGKLSELVHPFCISIRTNPSYLVETQLFFNLVLRAYQLPDSVKILDKAQSLFSKFSSSKITIESLMSDLRAFNERQILKYEEFKRDKILEDFKELDAQIKVLREEDQRLESLYFNKIMDEVTLYHAKNLFSKLKDLFLKQHSTSMDPDFDKDEFKKAKDALIQIYSNFWEYLKDPTPEKNSDLYRQITSFSSGGVTYSSIETKSIQQAATLRRPSDDRQPKSSRTPPLSSSPRASPLLTEEPSLEDDISRPSSAPPVISTSTTAAASSTEHAAPEVAGVGSEVSVQATSGVGRVSFSPSPRPSSESRPLGSSTVGGAPPLSEQMPTNACWKISIGLTLMLLGVGAMIAGGLMITHGVGLLGYKALDSAVVAFGVGITAMGLGAYILPTGSFKQFFCCFFRPQEAAPPAAIPTVESFDVPRRRVAISGNSDELP